MLIFLWRKHAISKAAMNDFIRILSTFNVPNLPKDFRGVMAEVKKGHSKILHGNHSFICPSCFRKSSNCSKCIFNGCESSISYVRTPTSVITFLVAFQLISILERENLVSSEYVPGECSDVLNSKRHQEIIMREKQSDLNKNIITLTINSDGTLVKRVSRSLWMTCVCINELPRTKRFQVNNMIICSVSTGSEKPKKQEYSIILQDIVNDLKILEEEGFDVIVPSNNQTSEITYTHFYAFAISAVCDKPAHSLMMNIKDSTGFFSCGWCCIQG